MIKKKWQLIWSRKYAPYVGSSYFKVFTTHRGYNQLQNKLFVPEGKLMAVYVAGNEWKQLLAKATQMLMRSDMKNFAVDYENKFQRFLAWGKKTARLPYRQYNNQQLIKLLQNCSQQLESSGETQFFSFVVLEGPGRIVEEKFKNQSDILSWISTPHKETKFMKIRLELLHMAKAGRVRQSDLEKYAKKYAWTLVYDIADAPLLVSDVRKQLRAIKNPAREIANYYQLRRQNLSAYEKFLKTIKDRKLKKLIEIIHYFSYLKEMRDDYRRQVYYLLKPIFQEIARRVGLSSMELNYLLHEEMVDLLRGKNKDYQVQARERMRNYSLVLEKGELKIFNFDVSPKYLVNDSSGTKISGTVASRGVSRGRVRIIFHRDDSDKFKKGEVLVTPMTHPEFLSIMKKASAIVTNEGGITCHAAIVSRELGIPCIIGTKIATKVLKDGDMVEVDAEKGVVRKI